MNASPEKLTAEQWEALCDGCAKCCDIGGGVACPKLKDNRCTDYENRHHVEACVKVSPGNTLYLHKLGILPDSCAYVRYMKGLPPEPKEYTLIPFVLASPEAQNRYVRKRDKYLRERWIA